jgi:hypothetical protein
LDGADQLIPIKSNPLTVLFQDHQIPQLHPFKSSEARAAIGTKAPAADGCVIFGGA